MGLVPRRGLLFPDQDSRKNTPNHRCWLLCQERLLEVPSLLQTDREQCCLRAALSSDVGTNPDSFSNIRVFAAVSDLRAIAAVKQPEQ